VFKFYLWPLGRILGIFGSYEIGEIFAGDGLQDSSDPWIKADNPAMGLPKQGVLKV
jgi:hypothetical protein